MADIRSSIENAVAYLTEHPDEARYTDSEARAVLQEGLRFNVEGPDGAAIVTDMPTSVGGGGTAPSSGWFFRAALAGCVGTLVAIEAARDGIAFSSLEVTVDSESDDRGILGMDALVPAAPLSIRVRVKAETDADHSALRAVLDRAAQQCPLSDLLGRQVPITVELAG